MAIDLDELHSDLRGVTGDGSVLRSDVAVSVHLALRRLPLARRISDVIPADALSLGWDVTADDTAACYALDRRIKTRKKVYQAGFAARASGGSWLWAVIDGDDQATPLGEGPHEVAQIHLLTRHEVTPCEWDEEPASPNWKRPSLLNVTPNRDTTSGGTIQIHASRMHYIPGLLAQPDENTGGQGYDLSVIDVYGEQLVALDRALSAGGRLVDRLSMPLLRIKDATGMVGDAGMFRSALQVFSSAIKAGKLMVLTGSSELSWSGPSMSGYGETVESLERAVCSQEGIGRNRLFGEQPRGIGNADTPGESMYADLLAQRQTLDYEPALLWLYALALGEAERDVKWPSRHRMTPLEIAKRSLLLAQRDQILVGGGWLLDEEARTRIAAGEERDLPELDEAMWRAAGLDMSEPMGDPPMIAAPPEDPAPPDAESE